MSGGTERKNTELKARTPYAAFARRILNFLRSPLSTLPLCFLSLTRNPFERTRNSLILNTLCGLDKTINLCIIIGRELSTPTSPCPLGSPGRGAASSLCALEAVSCRLSSPSPATNHEAPAANSFICHTSEKSAAKSFPCHTSENPLSQVLCLPHLRHPLPLCASRERRNPFRVFASSFPTAGVSPALHSPRGLAEGAMRLTWYPRRGRMQTGCMVISKSPTRICWAWPATKGESWEQWTAPSSNCCRIKASSATSSPSSE